MDTTTTPERETLDITRPLGELVQEHPTLRGHLSELGIELDDHAAGQTLAQLADELGVGLSIVVMALEASGYDVQGYDPASETDHVDSPLPDLVAALFGVDHDGNPLPDPDFSVDSVCATEFGGESPSAPMFAHMEDAIRRAQESGQLPKDDQEQGA